MAVPTVTLEGEVFFPNNIPYDEAKLQFKLSRRARDAETDTLILDDPMTVETDLVGKFTTELWPNARGDIFTYYTVELVPNLDAKSCRGQKPIWIGEFQVPESTGVLDFTDLLGMGASVAEIPPEDLLVFNEGFELLDDLLLTYAGSGEFKAVPGAIVNTKKDDYAYEIADNGEATPDLTTAGGTKLWAIPKPAGYNPEQFGEIGKPGGDDALIINKAALQAAKDKKALELKPRAYNTQSPIYLPRNPGMSVSSSNWEWTRIIHDGPATEYAILYADGVDDLVDAFEISNLHIITKGHGLGLQNAITGQGFRGFTLRNLLIEGDRTNTGNTFGLSLEGAKQGLIENVTTKDFNSGFSTFKKGVQSSHLEFSRCEAVDPLGIGFFHDSESRMMNHIGSRSEDNVGDADHGFYIGGPVATLPGLASGHTMLGCTTEGDYKVASVALHNQRGMTMVGGEVHSNAVASGILLKNSHGVHASGVSLGTFLTSERAIRLDADCSGIEFTSTTLTDPRQMGAVTDASGRNRVELTDVDNDATHGIDGAPALRRTIKTAPAANVVIDERDVGYHLVSNTADVFLRFNNVMVPGVVQYIRKDSDNGFLLHIAGETIAETVGGLVAVTLQSKGDYVEIMSEGDGNWSILSTNVVIEIPLPKSFNELVGYRGGAVGDKIIIPGVGQYERMDDADTSAMLHFSGPGVDRRWNVLPEAAGYTDISFGLVHDATYDQSGGLALMSQALPAGSSVVFMAGTLVVDSTVDFAQDGLNVTFLANAKIKHKDNTLGLGTLMTFSGEFVTVNGGTWDGNTAGNVGTYTGRGPLLNMLGNFSKTKNITIRNSYSPNGCEGFGVTAEYAVVEGIRTFDTGWCAIRLDTKHIEISGIHMHNTETFGVLQNQSNALGQAISRTVIDGVLVTGTFEAPIYLDNLDTAGGDFVLRDVRVDNSAINCFVPIQLGHFGSVDLDGVYTNHAQSVAGMSIQFLSGSKRINLENLDLAGCISFVDENDRALIEVGGSCQIGRTLTSDHAFRNYPGPRMIIEDGARLLNFDVSAVELNTSTDLGKACVLRFGSLQYRGVGGVNRPILTWTDPFMSFSDHIVIAEPISASGMRTRISDDTWVTTDPEVEAGIRQSDNAPYFVTMAAHFTDLGPPNIQDWRRGSVIRLLEPSAGDVVFQRVCIVAGYSCHDPLVSGEALAIGDRRYTSGGKVYECTTAGTTDATVPNTTGTGIVVGTATVKYVANHAKFHVADQGVAA